MSILEKHSRRFSLRRLSEGVYQNRLSNQPPRSTGRRNAGKEFAVNGCVIIPFFDVIQIGAASSAQNDCDTAMEIMPGEFPEWQLIVARELAQLKHQEWTDEEFESAALKAAPIFTSRAEQLRNMKKAGELRSFASELGR